MKKLKLLRRYFEDCTISTLVFPTGETFAIMERPALDNAPNISCIPEGTYELALRASAVVERTSKGMHKQGWEVLNVPARSYIMFHVGNYARNSEGCLLVGKGFSYHNEFMVTHSINSFDSFQDLMGSESNQWQLEVTSATYEAH